jgi:hypothetical protein
MPASLRGSKGGAPWTNTAASWTSTIQTLLDQTRAMAQTEATATGRHAEGALAPGAGMPGDAGDRSDPAHARHRHDRPQQGSEDRLRR